MAEPARSGDCDLVCLSHLWWDWVWQRPQHLLTRMARVHRVLWVEEPRIAVGPPGERLEIEETSPRLTVARLVYRSDLQTFRRRLDAQVAAFGAAGFDLAGDLHHASLLFQGAPLAHLERELGAYLAHWRRLDRPLIAWLYTPMAAGFVDLLRPDLVVYDVMDDLAAFEFPLPGLIDQQRELLRRADLVFAGGPGIRRSLLPYRRDVHLFPSGVEHQHFARACDSQLPLPADVAHLPKPVVGFFGVLDERIDFPLLAQVATDRPAWSWVLIGPATRIRPDALPRLPNLHYLGKRQYSDLPAYLKAFDVATMPFARNAATRSISPTKTLEYMAAHKPIVSTPIPDVLRLYGGLVGIGDGPEAFVAAVEAALGEDAAARHARHTRELEVLARSSWDATAMEMQALIDGALLDGGRRV